MKNFDELNVYHKDGTRTKTKLIDDDFITFKTWEDFKDYCIEEKLVKNDDPDEYDRIFDMGAYIIQEEM